jgi:pimeloyl-ACP methyl ester carboxylesterase
MAYYGTAQDEFVTIDGVQFAYRRFGATHGVPLLLLMHFRGTMDHWDPALVDTLGAARPVLLADNAGVGRSDGEVPKTFAGWAQHYIDILGALGIEQADVLGFSMGGCVAQLVALNAPQLVRRLVLCGTTPSTGPGVVGAPLGPFNQLKAAATQDEHRAAFLATFFNDSPESQAAGAASWERITTSRAHRVDYVGPESSHRQAVAFAKFMDPKQAENGSYNRLKELKMPVLIANGMSETEAGRAGRASACLGSPANDGPHRKQRLATPGEQQHNDVDEDEPWKGPASPLPRLGTRLPVSAWSTIRQASQRLPGRARAGVWGEEICPPVRSGHRPATCRRD